MSIRSTVTALSTTLALAVMLATASTPAFAEKSKVEQTKPPTIVEATNKTPKVEQARPAASVDLLNTGPKVEQAKPGSVVEAVNTGPKYEKDDGGSIVDVVSGPQQPTFKPDVRVVYQGQTSNGGNVNYRFRVENIGIETANSIGLSSQFYRVRNDGGENVAQHQYGHYAPIGPLATDQSQDVVITCAASDGFQCVSGSLSAQVDNDLNPNNNGAGSN